MLKLSEIWWILIDPKIFASKVYWGFGIQTSYLVVLLLFFSNL
jgi:hypothetical protein